MALAEENKKQRHVDFLYYQNYPLDFHMDNINDDTDVPDVDIDIDGINSNEEVKEVQIEKPGKLMSFPFKNSYLMIIYPVLEITIEAADDKTNEQVWIGLICFLKQD